MAETSIHGGSNITANMELLHGGRLVYSCRQPFPRFLSFYEAYRCSWLTKYRNRPSPLSFRQGKYNLVSFAFFILTLIWR